MEENGENPVNNGSNMVVRNEKGQIVSGVLNPKGKPKGVKHMTTLVEEALIKIAKTDKGTEIEIEKALAEKIVKMALDGNEQMIKMIWNYRDGMPSQNINLTNTDELRQEYFEKLNELDKRYSEDNIQK